MIERLRVAADVATVIVGVAVVLLVAGRYFDQSSPTGNPLSAMLLNAELDGTLLGVDFTAAERTVIMFVQQECPACEESLPFYRRLMNRDTDKVQVLFAAPDREVEIEAYLASSGIVPDGVFLVQAGQFPATATPTILIVDTGGVVTPAWVGRLSPDGEAGVFGELF